MSEPKDKIKGNNLFIQAMVSLAFGLVLIIAAIFFVDPEAHGNNLYNPAEIRGLVMTFGLILTFIGLLVGLVAYIFGPPAKPPEDNKDKK